MAIFTQRKKIELLLAFLLCIALLNIGCLAQNQNQNQQIQISEQILQEKGYLLEGNKDARVRIYVFSDYLCPYCAYFAVQTKELFEEYAKQGKIAVYYVDFIVHKESIPFALAARCSIEQNKQKEFHDEMYNQINSLMQENKEVPKTLIINTAKKLNLDVNKLTECVNNKKYIDHVYNSTITSKALGLLGTPSLAINNQFIPISYDKTFIKNEIDKRLNS
ncbi:MAG: thioredoxin domain-containing protein [Candidatus Aenigmatarchaeota archaeon]